MSNACYFQAIVSGWGTLQSGGSLSSTLQEVDVTTMTNNACSLGTPYSPSSITDNMICAAEKNGNGGKDSCQGDSGGIYSALTLFFIDFRIISFFVGPLITKDSSGGSFSQIGVVSLGAGCALANAPGVYSRVTSQLAWIQKNKKGTTCPMLQSMKRLQVTYVFFKYFVCNFKFFYLLKLIFPLSLANMK